MWPLLHVACDRGSDGVAAIAFLLRHLMLNVDVNYDQSHDVTNHLDLAIEAAGLKPFATLMCGVHNVPHGPWAEDTRYHQVVAGLKDIFEFEKPDGQPNFEDLVPKMLRDRGEAHRKGEDGMAERLWKICKRESPWSRKGNKQNSNKFLGKVGAIRLERKRWSFRLFG